MSNILDNVKVRDLLVRLAVTAERAKREGKYLTGIESAAFAQRIPTGVTKTDLIQACLIRTVHDMVNGDTYVTLSDTGAALAAVIRAERRACADLRDFDAACFESAMNA